MFTRTHPIPEATRNTIDDYVERGFEPGSFVRAVLENNLKDAYRYADGENGAALMDIICYCYWEIPGNCWGSPEVVAAWLRDKREA